ncbi:MAG: T9SS type A sorting domain-containing protein, partial [Flavisolibacter sp.]
TASPPITGSNDDFSSGQGWYCIAATVNPANPNQVVVGGLNTYRSSNGGSSWSIVARWVGTVSPYVHADQHYATWNGTQVLIASDGGIFYSNDGGVTYADRNVNLRIKQFYSVALHPTLTNYMIGGAQDNGMHQLNSVGLGSSVEVIGGDGAFSHIDQNEPQYQFGSYVYNQYRRSTDGGATWGSVNHSASSGQFINPTDYDDYNNRLYAAGNAGTYVRWNNPQSGNSFSIVSVGAFNNALVSHVMVSPHALNRVYFGTDGGRILKVDNADLPTPLVTNITGSGMNTSTVSCVAVGSTDNNLMATFSNYGAQHVWVTSTGGGAAGWTNITGTGLPDIPVRWAMFYPGDDTRAIIATEMGIYETALINGSSTVWTQNSSFPIVRTDMLQYRPLDGIVAAATHGRGIWTTGIPVFSTNVQFASSEATVTESTSVTSGCTGYRDYTVYMSINRPPAGDAIATLSVSAGSGIQGIDYDFTTNGNFVSPSNTITFPTGSIALQPVTIRIYDDANTEADETFSLSYTLSGTTDAVRGTESQTFTCTLKDNDLPPSLTGATGDYTIGTYMTSLSNATAFRSNQAKHRLQVLYRASEITTAGGGPGSITSMTLRVATKNSTKPFSNFTISMGTTAATDVTGGFTASPLTQVYTSNYSSIPGDNVFSFGIGAGSSSSFVWDGVSNIVIQYCFDNTASGAEALADVMEGSNPFAVATSIFSNGGAGAGCSLVAASQSVSRLNATFRIASVGNTVESALNATKTVSLALGNDVYYYNSNGKIMARIRDLSGFNYGCTQMSIDRAGTGATAFTTATNTSFLTDKTFHVVPTTNNAAGQYEITLYYTAAEKAGWEAATGNLWSSIRVIKVKSQISNYTPATPAPDGPNAIDVLVPVHGTYGSDYTLTATATTGFSGFAAGIPSLAPLPVNLTTFNGHLENNSKTILDWVTTGEQNARDFEVEKSSDGINYYKIGSVHASGTTSERKNYSFSDVQLSPSNYYRLRINDIDGRNKLSQIVLIRSSGARQNLWVVNNPFRDHIDVRLSQEARQVKFQLVNTTGSIVTEKQFTNITGQFTWQIPASVSKGTYILRAVVDGNSFSHKVIRQ